MPSTRDTATFAVRARSLMAQLADTHYQAMADLLSEHDFAQAGTESRMVQHPTTGVTLAVHDTGYRITFACEHTNMGIVDLPASSPYGLVAQVTVALHADLVATRPS
jgi:hypothetical protein